MRRWLAVAAMLASLGLGLALKLGRPAPEPAAVEAMAWFAARDFRSVRDLPLGQSGSYRIVVLDGPQGCRPSVVTLDRPDEILPLLRRDLAPAAWRDARLWLGRLEAWPADDGGLAWRRLLARLRDGVAPTPALVVLPEGCRLD